MKALSAEPDESILKNLATVLNDHVRFEERTLFNEVESLATPEQLEEMGAVLQEEKIADTWSDEFWMTNK
jgi:hypothetical protein